MFSRITSMNCDMPVRVGPNRNPRANEQDRVVLGENLFQFIHKSNWQAPHRSKWSW